MNTYFCWALPFSGSHPKIAVEKLFYLIAIKRVFLVKTRVFGRILQKSDASEKTLKTHSHWDACFITPYLVPMFQRAVNYIDKFVAVTYSCWLYSFLLHLVI